MARVITFFNKKGGTGKTSLAFSVAKDLNLPLLSNDDSVIEEIYPNKAKVLDVIEVIPHDCVYDLGGFVDTNIVKIFKHSDIIVVPTTLDVNSIKRTANTVAELQSYCSNIIIVVNRIQKNKVNKYIQSINLLANLGKPILQMRESEAVATSIHTGKTISQLYGASGFTKKQYANIFSDYTALLDTIKNNNKKG